MKFGDLIGQRMPATRERLKFPPFAQVVVAVALAIMLIQVVALIFPSIGIYLGPAIQLIVLAMASVFGFYLAFKYFRQPLTKIDVVVLIFMLALVVIALMFLPGALPEAFNRAALVGSS